MERCGERLPQRGRCRDHHPSFSSSLLDAIYRSIDDESDAAADKRTRGAPDPALFAARAANHCEAAAAVTRSRSHHRQLFTSTSSSSDGSSYGGFSSSDAECASSRRPPPPPLRPIRTGPAQPAPPAPEKKPKPGSIRSRFRDLRKTRQPASPGARLANFLNSLFAAGGGGPKKPKSSAAPPPPPPDSSTCSTASSFSRSCLSKTPPSSRGRAGEKRSVRFGPVSVIDRADRNVPVPSLAAQKKRVEQILRAFDVEAEREDEDDVASDASSDLFELENLSAVGGAGGGYTDELPVYETTHFRTHLALARSGNKKEAWI